MLRAWSSHESASRGKGGASESRPGALDDAVALPPRLPGTGFKWGYTTCTLLYYRRYSLIVTRMVKHSGWCSRGAEGVRGRFDWWYPSGSGGTEGGPRVHCVQQELPIVLYVGQEPSLLFLGMGVY